jgi:SMODS-associating 2TM, beta-strand rich effector domain
MVKLMYRVIPHKAIFLAIAWLVFGCTLVIEAADQILVADWLRPAQAMTVAWLVANLLLWKPIWRWVWKRFPMLNRRIFPDLNGIWDVDMKSNWPIHKQLIDAAAGRVESIDIEQCPEGLLAQLQRVALKAEIDQSWFKIEIRMWNPSGNTPIDRSDAASGLKPSGLFYFFKQQNQTQNLSDDNQFYGAARVTYDQKSDTLSGHFWTARMWGRAMNTAGMLTYSRSPDE